MIMMERRAFTGALTGAVCWVVGYGATQILGEGLSAISAYAALVGWWLTAYVSSRLALPVASALPLAVAAFSLFLLAAVNGQDWFYRDVSLLPFSAVLGRGLVQAAVISSPIIFDWLFGQVVRISSSRAT